MSKTIDDNHWVDDDDDDDVDSDDGGNLPTLKRFYKKNFKKQTIY